jgi:hypothetical protein
MVSPLRRMEIMSSILVVGRAAERARTCSVMAGEIADLGIRGQRDEDDDESQQGDGANPGYAGAIARKQRRGRGAPRPDPAREPRLPVIGKRWVPPGWADESVWTIDDPRRVRVRTAAVCQAVVKVMMIRFHGGIIGIRGVIAYCAGRQSAMRDTHGFRRPSRRRTSAPGPLLSRLPRNQTDQFTNRLRYFAPLPDHLEVPRGCG